MKKNHELSLDRQCGLLGISRSGLYYDAVVLLDKYHKHVLAIDRIYTECPFFGSRKISHLLKEQGMPLCRMTVGKLMALMGIEAMVPKRNLSLANAEHPKYPYLLRNLEITEINQVWSIDITYIPLPKGKGHVYLCAVIDWHSRYVLAWRLSNTLDSRFCVDCLEEAFRKGRPIFFNTDQGSQFTSQDFVEAVLTKDVLLSMDGKGRSLDNVFVERLWRSLKYEDIYLKGYEDPTSLRKGLEKYFRFYNEERIHEALDYRRPKEVHYEKLKAAA